MPLAVTLNLPPVTKYQTDSMFSPMRNVVIEATTKAGKTYGCILWILHEAGKGKDGDECWWVAPVFPQAAIAFRRLVRLLRSINPNKTIWDYNKTDMSVTLGNGVVIRFKSSDNPDTLYGEDVIAAVIDEASRCKEEGWHAVRSTLTATNGRVRIIGNVKGRHNWAYRLARKVEGGGLPNWHFAKITCYDAVKAGIIKSEEIDAARLELPEDVFRELYEGQASDDGSNPFGYAHIAACVGVISPCPPCVFGIDLAKARDWTVCIGLDDAGNVCFYERWQKKPWPETWNRLCEIVGNVPCSVDSTGVGDPVLDAMQRVLPHAEGLKFTPMSKQQLMEGLAVTIQSHAITYPDGPIRNELDTFEYEVTRLHTRYTAPEGLHDDCVCALALAVQAYKNRAIPTASWGSGTPEKVRRADVFDWGDEE